VLVASFRGPYVFVAEDGGGYALQHGAGGLASALSPLLVDGEHDVTWVAAALTKDDRAALAAGEARVPGLDLALLDLDRAVVRLHYDVISNGTLWFLYHGMFDLVRRPRFDHHFHEGWAGYVEVNERFAAAVVEKAAPHDYVLLQDYQLALVPGLVRAARPDLRIAHFSHTPFCGPNTIRVLPTVAAEQITTSMAAVPCGFHTNRWARAYDASVHEMIDPPVPPVTFTASLGPDPDALSDMAGSDDTREAAKELDELVGDRRVILRIDRIDPSKNIVRGFAAYERLLETHPEWRGGVVFVALLNPSRDALPEYLAYRQEVDQAADAVNARWARAGWTPVVVDARDDYPRSIAGLARYDVLLVNPIKDGLNLVAKEGPLVNRRDGVLCLSPEAGAFDELGSAAVPVHPYDIEQAAEALHDALVMDVDERATRAARLRELAAARTPRHWLADQIAAASASS
jgi:trehalose 6-phosphate synthase